MRWITESKASAHGNPLPWCAVDADQAHVARTAFRLYGKRHHLAGFHFGDCFAYALARTLDEPLLFKASYPHQISGGMILARTLDEPLLFKGTDFSLTDVAMYSKEQDAEPG